MCVFSGLVLSGSICLSWHPFVSPDFALLLLPLPFGFAFAVAFARPLTSSLSGVALSGANESAQVSPAPADRRHQAEVLPRCRDRRDFGCGLRERSSGPG